MASLKDDLIHLIDELKEDESIAMQRGKGDTACILSFVTVQLETMLERHGGQFPQSQTASEQNPR